MALTVEAKMDKAGPVLRLAGRLDTETTPTLAVRLAEALQGTPKHVVLDLARLDYISSAGLRAVLAAQKKLADHGGKLALRKATRPVAKVFEVAGLIPPEILASEMAADIYLEAIQDREAMRKRDVSA
jgi:anti-anti-sigma factor